jgi:hypothetical protein
MSQGTFPGFGPGVGAKLGGFLANPLLEQIFVWQVLQQISSAILAPEVAGLSEEIFKLNPSLQLPLSEAVAAVVKSHLPRKDGADEALLSGIDDRRFQILLDNAGLPPALDFLTQAWRRGFIPKDSALGDTVSLEQGIRESQLKNKWIAVIEAMQFDLPPIGVVVEAWLRAQIQEAPARALLYKAGVDDDTATLMYKSAGRPPGPMELIELTRRGIIPEAGEGGDTLSLRQGYLETDLKNKWYDVWKRLMDYIPPPRTVTALFRAGSITEAQARELFKHAGLSDELTQAYIDNAHHQRTAATRELTKSELVALYEQQAISAPELTKRLVARGYSAEDAAAEIELADMKVSRTLVTHAITRVRSLFTGHKIDEQTTLVSLNNLGVPATQRDHLLKVWKLERSDNVKHLTAAEVVNAFKDSIFDEGEALGELGHMGYGGRDAWIVLSVHSKLKLTAAMPADNVPPP